MKRKIKDLNIHYEVQGQGKAILLLHGWGCNTTYYAHLMNILSQKHKVIALDFPGFGQSEEPTTPWDVSEYTDFVLTFLQELEIKEISLIGHSFGGRVIIKLATLEQKMIKINRIVLIDPAGVKPKKTCKQKMKIYLYKAGKNFLMLPGIKQLYPDTLENLQQKNGSPDYRQASPMMRQILVKTVNEDLTPLLPFIKQSTLLVWGELDTATPLADGQLMEKLIVDSGLVVLKNGSHFAYLEQKEYVGAVLDEYFKTYI